MENLKSTNKSAEEYAKQQAKYIWDSWITDSTDIEEDVRYITEDDEVNINDI